jgi:hypothetical protein
MRPLGSLAPRWPEISALLDQALELPLADRDGWLERLQRDQADLAPCRGLDAATTMRDRTACRIDITCMPSPV